ncbi:Protein csh3 [Elasticomyces elasticus]|nr:Protein csh3 [Elasticomyces elasticus]
MHIIIGVGLLGFLLKLYKPSESNLLFDGGSLVLYMIAVIVYLTNIVKGLRIVSVGVYGEGLEGMTLDRADDVDNLGLDADTGNSVLGREDNLKVLAASNTILALVLIGVIVLQCGQWYAERAEEKERQQIARDRAAKKAGQTPKQVEEEEDVEEVVVVSEKSKKRAKKAQ